MEENTFFYLYLLADALDACTGKYCGRTVLENGQLTACGPCLCGFRPNASGICQPCALPLIVYDWLFLLFMSSFSLVLHFFFIDHYVRTDSKRLAIWHGSAIFEAIVSAIISILTSRPIGSLTLEGCGVKELSDWYTIFYNPTIDYKITIHCAAEAVCPLYSIVLKYYFIALILMAVARTMIASKFNILGMKKSIYAALYFFPLLIVTQAVLGGVLYFGFPYIVIVTATLTTAYTLAGNNVSSFLDVIKSKRLTIITVVHWLALAIGIAAATNGLKNPPIAAQVLLGLIPLPLVFYIITYKFTNPQRSGLIGTPERWY
ncbi:uncharacterized protein TRIADDRAFT_52772 [Trichoplax adhaerens]|uniref:JNK1/MAPK8-associated membrane protein n=1 Tax=Trichoplax adhaerens TaxID=10228 RepID=B3RKA4_TRIAD|nr:hypothetical protein TRIADDRAFT_52772 [Trichoplax adhaerens]EDV29891.1 hypothetical protein TRIADDRAFT_52772 [Trichoplax adhaerens]|eukprot:XP_002109093.1 hypothetical protein TRIADDRAFT_52772 [Trichoplax adhaerens]